MKVRLTIKSRNQKTGPIPVSTSSRSSCPDSCSFKENGCYADSGPLAIVWNQVDDIGVSWDSFCDKIADLPDNQLWRHNQAGDLPNNHGVIDVLAMDSLVIANQGKRGFTYTHHDMTIMKNRNVISHANAYGFTVNLSADNLRHADKLASYGIAPVVVVVPMMQTENMVTPGGRKVTICPATIRDDITCKSCGLCAIADRETIVAFPAHGASKRKLSEMVAI